MKTLGSSLISIAILLGTGGPAFAQVYKWVDENGRTHYSDKAPQTVKKVDTVTADRVSIYTAPEMPASVQPAAPANGALNDRVDRLERQLYAEQLARREAELAAYAQPQDYYYYVPVVGGAPIRNRHDGFRRPGTKPAGVVGPGIMPGTFNGPNAITAGNVTLRTSLPASRGRGASF